MEIITKDQVVEELKKVLDPEIMLDIWFLGLVYDISITEGKVTIEMTFTTPMCPVGPQIMGEVREKVGKIVGVSEVEVKLTFNPPWQPSDEVKGMLGMM